MSTINPAAAAAATSIEPPAALKGFRAIKDMFKEEHPRARKSISQQPHPVAWKFYQVKLGRAATVYTAGVVLFFGWPFAVKALINLNNGVYDKPTKGSRR
ncbi:hypothetical protein CLAFUW4_02574 [Fulvia fulva]|uniref:Uncharacterized protein n=1 Tax=Passalora fulva TaxID=5499 RepID=A0A9Q8P5J0_PASFU|nr:uncharacterized protein CLAFUR5_02563 [Fulvia fulva]KAK4631908.1 hypothetical protein CLAFUR4_02569 [Fulvia fulva]KAK4633532.1 hypothetical protein CLAFUR0_02573 [Fulvia fulva]UJO14175.1 hypothetical protein CLAFUR5_02563 [Fulvia fulva]WPV11830.1 hypothetical protein CLAFUW4_02574 [Fulvia fulva]WPV26007.1 hypothetical protein CLAFUW7_02574 [Fulvia fulva]